MSERSLRLLKNFLLCSLLASAVVSVILVALIGLSALTAGIVATSACTSAWVLGVKLSSDEERPEPADHALTYPSQRTVARVPSLMELSAHAVDRTMAWKFLAELCAVDHRSESPAVRKKIAAALVEKYADGLYQHIELLADQASLLPTIKAHYTAKKNAKTHQPTRERQLLLDV